MLTIRRAQVVRDRKKVGNPCSKVNSTFYFRNYKKIALVILAGVTYIFAVVLALTDGAGVSRVSQNTEKYLSVLPKFLYKQRVKTAKHFSPDKWCKI